MSRPPRGQFQYDDSNGESAKLGSLVEAEDAAIRRREVSYAVRWVYRR